MADFRRWFTVLAVMALFVGLASAQVGIGSTTTGSPFTCAVQNVTVTPQLRSEGYTEETGDIVLVCTGGSPIALGQPIPTVNVTVYYNVPQVTSRLIGAGNASEALLLIDEPNNGQVGSQLGYGPAVSQILCGSNAGAGPTGCPEFVGTNGTILWNNGTSMVLGATGVAVTATGTPGANMFQGVVSGSSVTFNGIPVLPPVTSGYSRVFRITNVRVNANGAGGGVAGGPGQVNASISISGATSLPISNPNPIVGYINQGLKGSVSGAVSFTQCNNQSGFAGILNFTEQFGTAFKTRVDGAKAGRTNNWDGLGTQNVPGYAYNSESNFVASGAGGNGSVTGGGFTAGLADFGTRLKATFINVPAGATVYVTTTNVNTPGNNSALNLVANPNSSTTAVSYAALLIAGAEGTNDTNGVPTATFTSTFTSGSSSSVSANTVQTVAMTSQGSNLVAIWEVLNTQPTVTENIQFGVYIAYTASATFPPAGSSQVGFSYAPNPTSGLFPVPVPGATPPNSPIPRFADTSNTTTNPNGTFFTINLCQTTLLFPYITTVTGFDTGLVIANTTTDPFKTVAQNGTCALNWYQGANNPPQTVTAPILSGTIWTGAASATTNANVGFSGYMIAVCNFQLAHGTAIVTDVGAQKILSAYLALVLPTGVGNRNGYSSASSASPNGPETLGN